MISTMLGMNWNSTNLDVFQWSRKIYSSNWKLPECVWSQYNSQLFESQFFWFHLKAERNCLHEIKCSTNIMHLYKVHIKFAHIQNSRSISLVYVSVMKNIAHLWDTLHVLFLSRKQSKLSKSTEGYPTISTICWWRAKKPPAVSKLLTIDLDEFGPISFSRPPDVDPFTL
jgi:hypothetical protein